MANFQNEMKIKVSNEFKQDIETISNQIRN